MNTNLLNNDDELEFLTTTLDNLIILKLMQQAGFQFNSVDIQSDEDTMFGNEELSDQVFETLGFVASTAVATEESGKVLGYEIFYDPDEVTIMETLLNHPDIDPCLQWIKGLPDKYQDPKLTKFQEMVRGAISPDNMYFSDYDMAELFPAEDLSSLVLLQTSMTWFNSDFVEYIILLIQFCREENKLREELEHGTIVAATQ